MREDFLYYIWKFKKFDTLNLKTTNGEELTIISIGHHSENAGPDFFNAQLIIGSQKWAGNVEIHVKSSDWYLHNHHEDLSYENVILHVVWQHDTEVFRVNNIEIPVLELKNYVNSELINHYEVLMARKTWIFCEKELAKVNPFVLENFRERLFLERLEKKSQIVFDLLAKTQNDWEATLFCLLAKNFGLSINGDSFLNIALSIPFSVVRKESFESENLEALLFGQAGLLDSKREDVYFNDMKIRYLYLINKYQIEKRDIFDVQFFKHRPDNFPTIRLSQLASLYHKQVNLFSKIITSTNIEMIYDFFEVATLPYWENHYVFDKESRRKKKVATKSFVNLLIINTLLPLRFAFAKSRDIENIEELISLLSKISPEKNAILEKFTLFSLPQKNAFESQALLELKKEYCDKSRCLQCAIGIELLQKNT